MSAPAVTSRTLPTTRVAVEASPIERLLQEPQRFEFHHAVHLIEQWLAGRPAHDRPALQFRNALSLAFPTSEIAALTRADDADNPACNHGATPDRSVRRRIELTPAFMGLLGTGGALPLAYSEALAAHEAQQRDGAARAFLDIFQHRAVTLFHAAWRKHRLPLQTGLYDGDHGLSLALSLAGLGQPALRERLHAADGGVADEALAYHAGILQRRCTSADQLQRLLADYFGVPVRIEQFVGRWCALEHYNLCALGTANATLGADAVLGTRVWQRDLRVRVVLGPLTATQRRRFLPGCPGAQALRELLMLVAGMSLEWEVSLHLHADAVAPARLTSDEAVEGGSQVGWTAFLLSRPNSAEREESIYELHIPTA